MNPMNPQEIEQQVHTQGWATRQLANGTYLTVQRMTYGKGRLSIGNDQYSFFNNW